MTCPRVCSLYQIPFWVFLFGFHVHFASTSIFQGPWYECLSNDWPLIMTLLPYMPVSCGKWVKEGKEMLVSCTGRKLPNWEGLGNCLLVRSTVELGGGLEAPVVLVAKLSWGHEAGIAPPVSVQSGSNHRLQVHTCNRFVTGHTNLESEWSEMLDPPQRIPLVLLANL